jgi:hypothetical protein
MPIISLISDRFDFEGIKIYEMICGEGCTYGVEFGTRLRREFLQKML